MRYLGQLAAFLVLLIVCSLLLLSVYNSVESATITELNTEQMIHAKQAATSIERLFSTYNNTLSFLAGNDHIIALDPEGRAMMQEFYARQGNDIRSITRVSKDGIILYTYPFESSTGANISTQAHVRKSISSHQVAISDVFTAIQGFRAVAYSMPVFRNGEYDGSISILIPFDQLAQKDLESIRILDSGYSWAVSEKGTILYAPDPALVDRQVFLVYNQSPTVITFISGATEGTPGISTYTLDAAHTNTSGPVKYQAAYFPVMMGDTHWSIIVATPEMEMLSTLQGFRNNLIIISGLLLIVLFFFAYYTTRAWGIIREEEKRKAAEAALREREEFLNNLVENIPDMILVKDAKDLRYVRINRAGEELIGYSREELIGKTNDDFFPKEKADSFSAKEREVLRGKKLLDIPEEKIRTRKQGVRVLHTKKIPLLDTEGNPQYLLGISEDITLRKRSEEELQKKSEELSAAYEEMTATAEELKHNFDELNRSRQALEQARKKLSLLNTITFQDIQNAIFSLSGFIQLETAHKDEAQRERFRAKQIGIVQSISDSLKFANNYQNLGLVPPVWQNVKRTFLVGVSHLDLNGLSRDLEIGDLEIYADPLLEHVFFTLAENVVLHGKTATEIALRYRKTENGLVLVFEDNGAGIPTSQKQDIFSRLYDKTRGQGLFLAREILGVTGITIQETGEPGKGARFEMTVPDGSWRIAGEKE